MPAWIDIQRKAIRYAFEELSVRTLEGEVLAANDAVRRLNRRHGFAEVGDDHPRHRRHADRGHPGPAALARGDGG